MNRNSILYWWPKVSKLDIPTPRTEIVEVPYRYLARILDGIRLPKKSEGTIIKATAQIGFPLFMRTDMASAKHQWLETCFVPRLEDLFRHIGALVNATLAAGMFSELDPNALVFREFLLLDSAFTAFSDLPISKERRYFIRDGTVECHHPYWQEDAIERSWKPPSKDDWRQLLGTLNEENGSEINLLTTYATQVAKVLDGHWSVDFACSRGTWYLIDMAEGDKSWHPRH